MFSTFTTVTWIVLMSLLWEPSMGVIAKVVPVRWDPESHKVSVVLLKYCSILFTCKCCNLSANVANTNEEENLHLFISRTCARGPREWRTLHPEARVRFLHNRGRWLLPAPCGYPTGNSWLVIQPDVTSTFRQSHINNQFFKANASNNIVVLCKGHCSSLSFLFST